VGLAPHPDFPKTPYVYVLYGRDGSITSAAPRYHDTCHSRNCETSGALGRLTWDADLETLSNLQNLRLDWCNGDTSHHMGDLRFDNDRNLILSNGDQTFFSNALNFGEAPNMCPWADPEDPKSGGVMQAIHPGNSIGKIAYIKFEDLQAWNPESKVSPPLHNHAMGFRNPCTCPRFLLSAGFP
jgi:glucose/arabinose dehydrogenase